MMTGSIQNHKITDERQAGVVKQNLKNFSKGAVNSLVGMAGFKLVKQHRWDDPRTFIPFDETHAWANNAGLSVGDYIDATHNVPGATQQTLEQMAALGAFNLEIERVCELGPGSGRYLERTLQYCNPKHYEIYETSDVWANWLVQKYKVLLQPTDGRSLRATPSCSIDLVHAHKVFPTMPFLTTMGYFVEIARVVRDGGKLVFDVMSEECFDATTLQKWLESETTPSPYPNLLPKRFVVDFFCSREFALDANFFISNKPGITEYLIFTKKTS